MEIILYTYKNLSDHDAQMIQIYDVDFNLQNYRNQSVRKIDKYSVTEFMFKLSFETWNDIFDVRGSVHHNTNRIEITNKMRPCSRIYYSNVS